MPTNPDAPGRTETSRYLIKQSTHVLCGDIYEVQCWQIRKYRKSTNGVAIPLSDEFHVQTTCKTYPSKDGSKYLFGSKSAALSTFAKMDDDMRDLTRADRNEPQIIIDAPVPDNYGDW